MCSSLGRSPVVLCAVTLALACSPPLQPPKHTIVRFTIGTPGGGIYPLGEALVQEYRTSFPDLDVEVREYPATVAAVARGDADVTLGYADVVYTTFAGNARQSAPPSDRVRGMAMLQVAPIHLVVGAHTAARSVRDLAGLRVGVGQPLSSTQLEAETLLEAYHVDRSLMRLESLPYEVAAERLSAGTLDAFFIVASYPAESVRRAMAQGAVLVSLDGPVIDALRQESLFLQPTVIPASTYPGQREAVHSLGVHNLLVCARDLDEQLVHELTRRFFEVLPSLVTRQDSLRLVDLQQVAATPIPLHPGAARYYRERELAR
jgi:uncharacterized protein